MQSLNTTTTTASEASKMLEAALQQMDGIISGTNANNAASVVGNNIINVLPSNTAAPLSTGPLSMSERSMISATNVLSTAKTLALALQQVGVAAPAPDAVTATIISDWLDMHVTHHDTDERLRRLQRDKESLALQYQRLVECVSEQADKIIELEGLLTDKTQQLSAKEEQLQKQMLSRSALETQQLELMSALSELKLHRAVLERENMELQLENGNDGSIQTKFQPFGSVGNLNQNVPQAPKTPPASFRHQIQPQFNSLPRSHGTKIANNKLRGVNTANFNNIFNNNNNNNNTNNNNRIMDANANGNMKQRNVAFASNEKILIDDGGNSGSGGGGGEHDGQADSDLMQMSSISQNNSRQSPIFSRGLRSFLCKLRRSNSGTLELEQIEPEFKRGGARATAGGRIEWSTQSSQLSASSKGYADWSPQEICNWLCDLGLGCYADDCKKWLKNNPNVCFFTASPVDIEKELNLKMSLHRKKILLAMDELMGKEDDRLALQAAQLDVTWVLRWLDDIGLPQYKDNFLQAKIDGRILHRLTLEDLAQLHVNSCLHIASLRRGIQCMREMEWQADCLIRRSTTKSSTANSSATNSQSEAAIGEAGKNADNNQENVSLEFQMQENIMLWTAHRVMEWLRVADLSEYAPNLRGAGVHGALMLYEPRFNADLLADLLSIPPSKTLLRRHLATQFKELLGRPVIQGKRDAEAAPGYQPLTITAKIKPPKKTQFTLKRRKSNKGAGDIEWTDYVCPMACVGGITSCSTGSGNGSANNSLNYDTNSAGGSSGNVTPHVVVAPASAGDMQTATTTTTTTAAAAAAVAAVTPTPAASSNNNASAN